MSTVRIAALIVSLGLLPGDALAKPPPEVRPITIVVTNATEVAKAHEGSIVVGIASMFIDVEDRVREEIVAQLGPRLQARGVQAVVGQVTVAVTPEAARGFYLWDHTTKTLGPATVTEGTFEAIQVTITNPDEVVKANKGGVALVAAKVLAMDVAGKVNETTAAVILESLADEGVSAMVAF